MTESRCAPTTTMALGLPPLVSAMRLLEYAVLTDVLLEMATWDPLLPLAMAVPNKLEMTSTGSEASVESDPP